MDRQHAREPRGEVIAFPAGSRGGEGWPGLEAGGAPRRKARSERRPVEELLDSLKGRRGRLADRLTLVSLAIEKLEEQLETKRHFAILDGSTAS